MKSNTKKSTHRFLVTEIVDGEVAQILVEDESTLLKHIGEVYENKGNASISAEVNRIKKKVGSFSSFDGWREDNCYLIATNIGDQDLNKFGVIYSW